MRARLLSHALVVALLLAAVLTSSPVQACEPYPGDAWNPPGYAGCELTGNGVASVWNGETAATNQCVFPWQGCTPLRVESVETGAVIEVVPAMYCHCWVGVTGPNGETERLVDLTVGQVRALGLDPAAGLFDVKVTPVTSLTFTSSPLTPSLPDTAVRP